VPDNRLELPPKGVVTEQEYFTPSQLAELLQVRPNTITRKFADLPGVFMSLVQRLAGMGRALDATQLARLLGVHKLTVYRLVERGALPHFRIASCIRFDPSVVAEWLQQHEIARHGGAHGKGPHSQTRNGSAKRRSGG
jgi:excisionase family DNA binding protein